MRSWWLSAAALMAAGAVSLAAQSSSTPASRPPAAASPSISTSQVADALLALSRIGRDTVVRAQAGFTWRSGADGAPQASLWVAGEFDAAFVGRLDQWDTGADVSVEVRGPGGSVIDAVRQTLTRESRSFVVRLPAAGAVGPGAYDVWLTSKAASTSPGTTQTLQVTVPAAASGEGPLLGQPSLFRSGPFAGPEWAPVADLRFRRQERARIEAAIVGAAEPASARLLDRTGSPLPLPVVSSERQEAGARIVSGEVALAPLTAGDYILEISVGSGSSARRALAAFRIIP
jgi:hypothetical protein